jgi:hypothetical protein
MNEKSELTGYETAKIVNEMLNDRNERLGTEMKAIPPQMIYNYVRNGYIEKNGNDLIDVTEAVRFAEAYVEKRTARELKRVRA